MPRNILYQTATSGAVVDAEVTRALNIKGQNYLELRIAGFDSLQKMRASVVRQRMVTDADVQESEASIDELLGLEGGIDAAAFADTSGTEETESENEDL